MLEKEIIYFRRKRKLICDGKCNKAWGLNSRPFIQLDKNNIDDICWLSDNELEDAPANPGTYEGFEMCAKPINKEDRLNKWCARECERRVIINLDEEIKLRDWSKRIYNISK